MDDNKNKDLDDLLQYAKPLDDTDKICQYFSSNQILEDSILQMRKDELDTTGKVTTAITGQITISVFHDINTHEINLLLTSQGLEDNGLIYILERGIESLKAEASGTNAADIEVDLDNQNNDTNSQRVEIKDLGKVLRSVRPFSKKPNSSGSNTLQ